MPTLDDNPPGSWPPTHFSHAGGSGADPEETWRRNLSFIANRSFQWFGGSSCLQCRSKSKLRKWLARKVRVRDALVPHWASLPAHPRAVIVCVMFKLQLLASTAQFCCSHFCQRTENSINRVCSCRRRKNTSSSQILASLVSWSSWELLWDDMILELMLENLDFCWMVVLVEGWFLWQKFYTRSAWGWWLSW